MWRLVRTSGTLPQPFLGSPSSSGTHEAAESCDHCRLTVVALCVSFSPDGTRLACGNRRGDIIVVDLETGKSESLTGHRRLVNDVTYSRDGTRLVSGAEDRLVKLWDTRTGQELLSLEGGGRGVAFGPNENRLVTGNVVVDDGSLTVWAARRNSTR